METFKFNFYIHDEEETVEFMAANQKMAIEIFKAAEPNAIIIDIQNL
jgi:hypothetical protein